jgi:anaerobic selenocysteine-containing dehydrogenase
MTGPSLFALNSTFRERNQLRKKGKIMFLQMNPNDAAGKIMKERDPVTAFNHLGEVPLTLRLTPKVPLSVVVQLTFALKTTRSS